MIRWGVLLALSLMGLAAAFGASTPWIGFPHFTNYDPERFSAPIQHWVALQDARGVMYFGNSTGILEFDGQRWQQIPTPGNVTTRSLTKGPDGTIYYGSIGDLGYLEATPTGKLSAVSLKGLVPAQDQSFSDIWQVESTPDGVYFLTRSRLFRLFRGKITTLPGKFAPSQACVLNGTLFYADLEKGLCLIQGDQVVPIPQCAGVYNGKRIALAPFGPQALLVARLTGDFLHIDLSSLWNPELRRYSVDQPSSRPLYRRLPTEADELVKEDRLFVYKLISLGPDAFAMGTVKGGVVAFDRQGRILAVLDKTAGLLDNTVTSLLLDHAQNLWATSNQGISHIEWSVPQSILDTRAGIDGVALSIQRHADRLFVGTFQHLLVQDRPKGAGSGRQGRFHPLPGSPREIWQLMEVEGDLLAASGEGLYRIKGETVERIAGSSRGALCLGTSPRWPGHVFVGLLGGVEVYQRSRAGWALVGRLEHILENIRAICADSDGDLWLSTDVKGLLRLHMAGPSPLEVRVQRFGTEQGLPELTRLRAIAAGGTVFVATAKGLYSAGVRPWRGAEPDPIRFRPDPTLGPALPETELVSITADPSGGFLVLSAKGATRVTSDATGGFRSDPRPFKGLGGLGDTIQVDSEGGVWFPGKTLQRVELTTPKAFDQPFDVLIRRVSTKSKRLLFEGTHSRAAAGAPHQRGLFLTEQPPTEQPDLPFAENTLAFDFTATFFEKPGTTQFQVLLEGFDRDWSDWAPGAFKEYTNVPEGRYRFRVRARNLYGTLGREAAYTFVIRPPWYRTPLAILAWILGGGGLLVGIVYLYTLRLRWEKEHLEDLVAQRTRELQEASLTDPLTGLRNRRFISEVLSHDISAFTNFKQHLLRSHDHRSHAQEELVFGLFLIDLDHFKQVNDSYGHDAGDQVLKQFAEILKPSVRQDDVVMRIGGEEFLVVLKKTTPEYLDRYAERLQQAVAEHPFDLGDGRTIHKTCSMGYTRYPLYSQAPGRLTLEQTIMVADLGLYYAKNHGRNLVVSLGEGRCPPTSEQAVQKTVTSLEFAVKEGHLVVQPRVR